MHWPSRIVLVAVGVALGAAAIVFASLNHQPVPVDLYFGEPATVPLWAVVACCLVVGAAVPVILGVGGWLGRRRERNRLRRRVAALEREVLELRNIPLDTLETDEPAPAERAALVSTGRMPRQVVQSPPSPGPSLLGETRRPLLPPGSDDDDDVENLPQR